MGPPLPSDRIVRDLHALDAATCPHPDDPEDRALRRRMLDVIGTVIPYDFYAFVLTDPQTTVGTSPLAEVPDLDDLPRVIRLKYLTRPGRWTTLDASGCTTLLAATGGDLGRSDQWEGALRQHGVTDVLVAVLRDRHGTWGFLDLWRRTGVFASAEVAAVASALPRLTAAVRNVVARSFVVGPPAAAPKAATAYGPGVLLLGDDLTPVAGTRQLRDWLTTLLPTAGDAGPVPASALNVAAQLLAVEAGVDDHPPSGRVALAPGTWLTVRADRLTEPLSGASIAVGYELTSPADRLDLFARAHAMSPRESDVVVAVATGLDTRGAARRLGITELTVQDHLKSVFARTGAASRADLLARALGS
ncbi:helix-turn-helix transcriptional regulator [Pedococcus bigeumensis]|uniref:helix-turn-helix transcriptional regulator n=1 Tax=Pedococcus bigeumensis TaxID=433644 RepID=UPI0019D6614E|nr:helix-turn-helix transcriptional regulator [Pedococcus bigeumensis]